MMQVGVLLSGCGFKDGSEIHESVFAMHALQEHGADVRCIAVDSSQNASISHLDDSHHPERNMLEESARIARGAIESITSIDPSSLSALVIPGGFGAASSLSNFSERADNMEVLPEVQDLISELHRASKPIGAICIAPVIVAKVLASHGPRLTIGHNPEIAGIIEKWGGTHVNCKVTDHVVDEANRIYSTPAYMFDDATMPEVKSGIDGMVSSLARSLSC